MPTKVHFENIKEIIIAEIKTTNYSIDIAVAWITEPKILSSLIDLLNRKITVRILSFDDKINSLEKFKKLYYLGAEIRLSKKLMHNKFCVIDSVTIISGSFNWTRKASYNNENITVIKNEKQLSNDFKKEFDKLWVNCKNIDSKLKINNEFLEKVESEFQSQLWAIEQYSFPVFYFVKENVNNINFRNEPYRSIEGGYFLLKNLDEAIKSLRYIFYAEKEINIRELKKNSNIDLELVSERFCEIYTDKSDKITEIKSDVYASRIHDYYYRKVEIYLITSNGDIIDNEIQGYGQLKDNKELILDVDGYKILTKDSRLIDFQTNQKVKHNSKSCKYHYKPVKILTEENFVAGTIVDTEKYTFRFGLYNEDGYNITRAVFTDSSYEYIKDKNQYVFKEYPVAYWNHGDLFVKYLDGKNNNINIFKVHALDLNKNRLFYSIPKIQQITPEMVKKLNYTENTVLYYASGKKYGILFFAMSILKFNLKQNDFNKITDEFHEKTELIKEENKKLLIAKTIIGEYSEKYLEEKIVEDQRLRLLKLEQKNTKSDSCFIATKVYGDLNHPYTIEFRQYRDDILVNYYLGRLFIKVYYKYSPSIVEYINDKPRTLNSIRFLIERIRILIVNKKK